MVDPLKSSLGREAILAALKDQSSAARDIRSDAAKMFEAAMDTGASGSARSVEGTKSATPASSMIDGLMSVNQDVQAASSDALAKDLINGDINSIHEVAMRINRAKISFDFAMEVRNKLIEAYRETMRMGV